MEFEKDQFEDDEELSRLDDDEELGGEPGGVVEEEEELLIVEEEPGDEGDEPTAKPAAKPVRDLPSRNGEKGNLPIGEHRVLTAVAQHRDLGGVTREQLTVLTGYKRSSRDAYLQRLRAAGRVEVEGDLISATQAGIDALGSRFAPLPTGAALRDHWLRYLPEGERRIFEYLISIYPSSAGRDALSETTGYKRSSRDAYLQRLRSRKLITDSGRAAVIASEILFQ